MTNASAKFKAHLAPVKPGDFGPIAYAVWGDDILLGSETVRDGDVVEALGPVEVCTEGAYDDMYEVAYRVVRLADGFVGKVCWSEYDGRSGFEAI